MSPAPKAPVVRRGPQAREISYIVGASGIDPLARAAQWVLGGFLRPQDFPSAAGGDRSPPVGLLAFPPTADVPRRDFGPHTLAQNLAGFSGWGASKK